MKKRLGHISLGLGLTLLLPFSAWAQERWDKIVAEAKKEGKVAVTGPPVPGFRQGLTDGFRKAFGISLEYSGLPSGEMAVRLERETAAGRVSIDSNIGGASSSILNEMPKGFLEPLADKLILPEVADPKLWRRGKLKWVDNQQRYVLQTAEWVMTDLILNKDKADPNRIAVWADLLKPEWKGKIASYDPRRGGPGNAVARYLLHQYGEEFVVKLYKEQNVTFTQDLRQLVEWVARGTHPVALGAVQVMIETFRKEGFPIVRHFPKDLPGSLLGGYGTIVLIKGAPHANAATVFINWFASKEGQEIYAREMLEPSLRTDVRQDIVPEYVIAKPGVDYKVDQYSEEWMLNIAPKVQKRLAETLGR
ncbi:MAG TPA: extracellular solute-binding protein [Candidatus Binatia bacterium]|jgi:ABC-type Fe3+ transport system substrate-binding protein